MNQANTPLLSTQGLSVRYGSHTVLSDVDIDVDRGEVVALVGASGSGKSTLAHAILGLLPAGGRVVDGRIDLAGRRLDELGDREWDSVRGRAVGLVPQDPGVSLNPVEPVGWQVAEALRVHGRVTGAADAHRAVVDILTRSGIDRPELRARQLPHQLSGGQRQRVLIGIAVACDPDLVVADEPTSALDVQVAKQILDHLDERIGELGTAVLLITHDLAVAADRAQRVVVLESGRVVEQGPVADVLTAPRREYTRRLLAAVPRRVLRERPEGVAQKVLVAGTDLSRTYGDSGVRVAALHSVSVEVTRGRTLAVVGESGSGKTTLARIVAGIDRPDGGTVTFDGRPVDELSRPERRAMRRRIQFVHQNPFSALDPRMSVNDIVAEPLQAFGICHRRERPARVRGLLAQVGLDTDLGARRPAHLSGGQRQRVAIARALAADPDLVVLDEPVSALDVLVQAQILELFVRLQDDLGVAYLLVSHDLAVVGSLADHVMVMRQGTVVESTPTSRLFTAPESDYTRTLLDAIPGAGRTVSFIH